MLSRATWTSVLIMCEPSSCIFHVLGMCHTKKGFPKNAVICQLFGRLLREIRSVVCVIKSNLFSDFVVVFGWDTLYPPGVFIGAARYRSRRQHRRSLFSVLTCINSNNNDTSVYALRGIRLPFPVPPHRSVLRFPVVGKFGAGNFPESVTAWDAGRIHADIAYMQTGWE